MREQPSGKGAWIASDGTVRLNPLRWPAATVGLPTRHVELPVRGGGHVVGTFILTPTPSTPISHEQCVVAVALADQLGRNHGDARDRGLKPARTGRLPVVQARCRRRKSACRATRSGRSTRPSGSDQRRTGRGEGQRGGRTLGPRPAHVGVVEEEDARAGEPVSLPGAQAEGRRVGPHVRDGRRPARSLGPAQQARRPPRRGKGGDDVTAQSVHLAQWRCVGPVRRRDEQHEVEGAARHRLEPICRGGAGTDRGATGRWRRSAAGPRPRAIPCTRAAPCRAGWAAGRTERAQRERAAGRGGAPRRGRRSRRAGQRLMGLGRCGRPRARGRARGTGQVAGGAPGSGAGAGRCRRKVPVARLTSAPSASRTVASP